MMQVFICMFIFYSVVKKQPGRIALHIIDSIAFLLKHSHVAGIKRQAVGYFLFDTDKNPVLIKCIKHNIITKLYQQFIC